MPVLEVQAQALAVLSPFSFDPSNKLYRIEVRARTGGHDLLFADLKIQVKSR